MAETRLDAPTTTIQPTPGTTAPDVQAAETRAAVQGQGAQQSQLIADQITQLSTQVMKDETLKQAQRDAAQVVTPGDVDGMRGWGGLVYSTAYNEAALQQYRGIALNEAQAKGSEILTRNPANPDAVRQELGTYLEAKRAAMPKYIGDSMIPHFTSVLTGATSSAAAGKAREDMAVGDKQSREQFEGYVQSYAQAQASPGYMASDPTERAQTDAMYADRWKMIDAQLAASGHTPAYIADLKGNANALAAAAVKGYELKNRVAAMPRDPVGVQKVIDEADAWARDPSRSQYYTPIRSMLNDYIGRGIQLGGATREQVAQDQQYTAGDIADKVARLKVERETQKISVEDYRNQMDAIKQEALTKGAGRLPGQQAQLLAAAGDSAPLVQQAYGSAMLMASGRAMYGATQEIRNAGRDEVRGIITDPHVVEQSGSSLVMSGLMQQGQKILALSDAEATIPNQALLKARLESQDISAKDVPQILSEAVKAGTVGPLAMTGAQFASSASIGLAKAEEHRKDLATSQEAMNGWNPPAGSGIAAQPATAERIAALEKTNPTKFYRVGADGKPQETPFDPSLQAHRDALVGTVIRRGYLPQQGKTWLSDISPNASQQERDNANAVGEQIRKVVAGKHANLPDSVRPAQVDVDTAVILGAGATAKLKALRIGAGDPVKTEQAMAVPQPGRQATPAVQSSVVPSLTDSSGFYSGVLTEGVGQGDYGGGKPGFATQLGRFAVGGVASLLPGNSQLKRDLMTLNVFDHEGLRASVGALPVAGDPTSLPPVKPGNIKVEPNALQMLDTMIGGEGGYLQVDGGAAAAQGHDPRRYAFIKALKENPDKFSMVYKTDAATGDTMGVLTLHDFRADFRRANPTEGPAWSDNDVKNFAYLGLQNSAPYYANQMDKDSLEFRTRISPDGTPAYYVTANHRDPGRPPFEMLVRPDDKIFDTARLDLARNIGEELRTPSLTSFIASTWGLSLAKDFITANKQHTMLDAATGRNGPSEAWASTIDSMRQVVEAHNHAERLAGNQNVQDISEKDWNILRSDEAQKTINRHGSLYYLMFGSYQHRAIASQGGTLDRPPADVQAPSPLAPAQEMEQATGRLRSDATPEMRARVEGAFKPPGKRPGYFPPEPR